MSLSEVYSVMTRELKIQQVALNSCKNRKDYNPGNSAGSRGHTSFLAPKTGKHTKK